MKSKFAIGATVFLLLCSFTLSCGVGESKDTTLVATAAATTTTTSAPWDGHSDLVQEERDEQVRIYLEADHAQKQQARAAAAREVARKAQEARNAELRASRAAAARSVVTEPAEAVEPATNVCGGDLPPCWVLRRENRAADPRLWNGGCYAPIGYTGPGPCGSTASGVWQIIRSTWGSRLVSGTWVPGFGGYMNAADAPVEVQLQKVRALWAGGKGCSHWRAC